MRLYAFVAAAAMLSASFAARADTLVESFAQTYNNFSGSSETSFGVELFNPDLGTLNSVTQSLTGTLSLSSGATYEFSTGPILSNVNGNSADMVLNASATLPAPELEATSGIFEPEYEIVPFDLTVSKGTLTSLGPVVDSFTFNYTPAPTPEPSSFLLLGTGLLGVVGVMRKRFA